jgi:hypothetical protein
MAFQTVFQRYEMKYLLSKEQKAAVQRAIAPYMALDAYGRTVIRNLYLDTESFRLVRRSIEKPVYKEKMRIRCYGPVHPESTVFVELKKKYKKIVYKRRVSLPEREAMDWILGRKDCPLDTQISKEVDYFLQYYGPLRPVVFLSYAREAYFAKDGSDFRVTFDEDILCRREDLSLQSAVYGTPLLPEGQTLMEIKCSGGIPLWLTHALSAQGIRQTSFSKYGTAYQTLIYPNLQKEALRYA